MRSISGLLSLIAIKFSNLKVSNSSRNASVIFMVSLILLSMISVSDLAGAQLVSSQDDSSTVTDTPRTNNNTINPKTECNEPIEINNVSSSSFDNTNNEDDDGVNAKLAFDSDEGTEWSEDRAGAYLEFDIGAIRSICDIEIQWDKGEERSYNFVVSVSENGTKFKDRIRATSSGNSDLPELYSFPDTMAKQVRLTVYGNSEDDTASIREISVNGRDVRKIGQGYKICEELPVAKFVATPSRSGDPPEKAVDGDYTTAWSAEGAGSFLQADVGEVKSICHVGIAWYNGESRQYVFEVSVSKDGINFDQVYEGISSGNSIRPQYYAFSEADARYVRITVFSNDKDNWAGITELSIKGFTPPLPPNNPPVADPKSVSTDRNVPIPITLSGSDPEVSILTFNIVDLPKHGQLSSVSSDAVKYTPDKDYSGSDSFTYTVKDSKGLTSAKSTVSINIKEVLECRTLNPTVVTAIGSDGANVPSNVIDKNLNTGWSKDGTGSWIQFDLGSPAKICSVDIAWYRGDMRQNVFTISVSDDGSVFKKVFDGGSKGTATGFEKYNLPSGTEGKFVRITVNGNTENNWASITEIALFGVRSTSEPPSPPPSQPPSPPPSEPPSPPPSEPPSPPPSEPPSPPPSEPPSPPPGGDAGQNDQFGIKKIYASKPNGEKWFMNMQDPSNDPRSNPPSMSKNSDGSWRVTSGQVRYGVYTSSGYHPDQVETDHSVLASRGYMQSPNDWKNVELTGQVKFNSGDSSENWAWYARGGRHTGSGSPEGCEGSSLKGDLTYTDGTVRWAKEQWHVSYVFAPWENSPASADGKFVGFKAVMYNTIINGETAVKLELWVDPNNNNNWQKVYDFIDQGGWGSEGGECNGEPDQIISWGGPIASFRWDGANSVDIKNLSVREIVPPQ